MKPTVRVLGSADWHVTADNDHSCYTVSDRILVDACPSVVPRLQGQGVDPCACTTICFTHMHSDHYMGLAPLLLFWRVRFATMKNLTIVGPRSMLRRAFEASLDIAINDNLGHDTDLSTQIAEMPTLLEFEGDETFETENFVVFTTKSDHAVPGLCYRFVDKVSGHVVGFSGDTRILPTFGCFVSALYKHVVQSSCKSYRVSEASILLCKKRDSKHFDLQSERGL